MTTLASQITSLTVVYSIVYSGVDQRKHQSSASLSFVRGIHRDRWIPRTKGQLRRKCFHLMTSSWLPVMLPLWYHSCSMFSFYIDVVMTLSVLNLHDLLAILSHTSCFLSCWTALWSGRADSRFAPSQWEMSLQSNAISHWLGTNLESAPLIPSWCGSSLPCNTL